MMKKILLSLIALLVICTVLLFTIDLGFLRESLQTRVQQLTGRAFTVDENLSIRLGSSLKIKAENLRLDNADWSAEEVFLSASRVYLEIDTVSLLFGPPIIKRLEVSGLDVLLQQNEAGLENWQLLPVAPADQAEQHIPFLLEFVTIVDGRLTLDGGSMAAGPTLVSIGGIELNFTAEPTWPAVPEFDLQLFTETLDLRPFQLSPEQAGAPEVSAKSSSETLIPDINLPLQSLLLANGRFSIKTDRILLQRTTLLNNVLLGEVRDGALSISRMSTDGFQGRFSSHLSLVPDGEDSAILKVEANSKDLILNLAGYSAEEMGALPAFDIDVKLEGKGRTLHDLASALNGHFNMQSSGGLVKNISHENTRDLLLARLLSSISPSTAKQEVIEISCVVIALKIHDGVVLLDPGFALQSEKLNVFATGNIDLASEEIDVNFRTQTRSAAKLSVSELISPYVKLSGTLTNPSVALDVKGTLLSGGAAYLSGGLSILVKKALDHLGGTEEPCARLNRQ